MAAYLLRLSGIWHPAKSDHLPTSTVPVIEDGESFGDAVRQDACGDSAGSSLSKPDPISISLPLSLCTAVVVARANGVAWLNDAVLEVMAFDSVDQCDDKDEPGQTHACADVRASPRRLVAGGLSGRG